MKSTSLSLVAALALGLTVPALAIAQPASQAHAGVKQTPAKKAPAKKVIVKKTPAKKAPVKKKAATPARKDQKAQAPR